MTTTRTTAMMIDEFDNHDVDNFEDNDNDVNDNDDDVRDQNDDDLEKENAKDHDDGDDNTNHETNTLWFTTE